LQADLLREKIDRGLTGTLLDELERRDLKRGLLIMCAAGGKTLAIIVERMSPRSL
jgi:hypothetical protein